MRSTPSSRFRVWQFGSPMIIFLAGLRQMPQDVYEAAQLDGAGKARQFFKITLPLLTPVIFFNAVVQTIDAFKAFTPAFIISERHRRPGRFDPVLHAVSLPGGVRLSSAWATPRRSPGFSSSIIAIFTAFSFLTSRYWVHYDE